MIADVPCFGVPGPTELSGGTEPSQVCAHAKTAEADVQVRAHVFCMCVGLHACIRARARARYVCVVSPNLATTTTYTGLQCEPGIVCGMCRYL